MQNEQKMEVSVTYLDIQSVKIYIASVFMGFGDVKGKENSDSLTNGRETWS